MHSEAARQVNPKDYLPPQAIAWLEKRHSDRIQELIAGDKVVVAISEGGELLGFASRFGPEIHGLCVAVDHVRKGLGTKLLAQVEAEARREGITEIIAQILACHRALLS